MGVTELKRWTIEAEPVPVSDFFQQRLERLQRFDLESLEVSKTLLIDAICEEGLETSQRLKVWKGPYLGFAVKVRHPASAGVSIYCDVLKCTGK
ncbi:MAG: hypothetical protein ACFB14_25260 [Leptolyngbyaceae cyanobacterium]